MKQIISIFLISVFSFTACAQIIRNGDFGNNILGACAYNVNNVAFDSSMPYCHAFGSAEELDVQDNATCPMYSLPSHGRWFILIHTQEILKVEALSLLLYPTPVAGKTYQLAYFEKN